jgi:hypothetical protein
MKPQDPISQKARNFFLEHLIIAPTPLERELISGVPFTVVLTYQKIMSLDLFWFFVFGLFILYLPVGRGFRFS